MTKNNVIKTFLTLVLALGVFLLIGYIWGYPVLSRTPFGVVIDLPIGNYIGGYPSQTWLELPDWYAGLIKPIFSPPSWVFSPAWIISFFLMGLSLFFILKSATKEHNVRFGLILFCLQLLCTLIWAYAFFGIHAIFPACLCIIALWATLLSAIIQVSQFSVYGGMLLVPYFLWVCYLVYLNYGIMVLNNLVFVI